MPTFYGGRTGPGGNRGASQTIPGIVFVLLVCNFLAILSLVVILLSSALGFMSAVDAFLTVTHEPIYSWPPPRVVTHVEPPVPHRWTEHMTGPPEDQTRIPTVVGQTTTRKAPLWLPLAWVVGLIVDGLLIAFTIVCFREMVRRTPEGWNLGRVLLILGMLAIPIGGINTGLLLIRSNEPVLRPLAIVTGMVLNGLLLIRWNDSAVKAWFGAA
jgi:hypothetical protein